MFLSSHVSCVCHDFFSPLEIQLQLYKGLQHQMRSYFWSVEGEMITERGILLKIEEKYCNSPFPIYFYL